MRRPSSTTILAATASLSVLIHFAPMGAERGWSWLKGAISGKHESAQTATGGPSQAVKFRSKAEIDRARRQLVEEALAARKVGGLVLGDFLLHADALDAEEARIALDAPKARRLFDQRCTELRTRLKRQEVVPAVTDTFSSYAYSMAVNRMSDMLLAKVGACGPTTQLIAACLYDAKQRDGLSLRFWGGVNQSGTTHVTATWTEDGIETDLANGARVDSGGKKIDPEQLIEAYARAHGILPALPQISSGPKPRFDAAATADFQYPPNKDVFESGDVPLFSERRAAAPGQRRGGRRAGVDATGFGDLSWAVLDPELLSALSFGSVAADIDRDPECVLRPRGLLTRTVTLTTPTGSSEVELMPVLSSRGLSVMAGAIARYERRAPRATDADRLTAEACLALSYGWAAPRFSAAGFDVIAQESARRAKKSLDRARQLHARLDKQSSEKLRKALRGHADQWTLVAFEAGEKTLLKLETERPAPSPQDKPSLQDINLYIHQQRRTEALLNQPRTRGALIEASESYDLDRRMMFLGRFASLRLMNPGLEIPKTGWLPGALAAYDKVLEIMRQRDFGSEAYFKASLELLRAAGASPEELRERKREHAEVRKRIKQGRTGGGWGSSEACPKADQSSSDIQHRCLDTGTTELQK